VCELVTSKNQIKRDKSTPTFQLVVASVTNNNASSFDDKPSSTFQLVVVSVDWISKGISNKPFRTLCLDRIKNKMPFTFQLIVGSKQVHQKKLQRIKANANLQTTRREAAPQFNVGCFYELIVDSKYPNCSHQLIVRYKYSTISLHFCEDCRIFREGVKDDEGVFVKQQSANIPDAVKKWRCSSNSNDDATCVIFNEDVSHRVDVASEHGDDYDDNNPLQRLILPLISTPEAEMQMAVNVFELAGACIFCIIIRNKPQQLIGEQFIASNNSVVGFQLVVESILILHSEGAQVASASLQTFADGDQAASQSDTSELIVETPSLLMLRDFERSAITAVMNGSFSFKFIVAY